jgi:hypothetical protein
VARTLTSSKGLGSLVRFGNALRVGSPHLAPISLATAHHAYVGCDLELGVPILLHLSRTLAKSDEREATRSLEAKTQVRGSFLS